MASLVFSQTAASEGNDTAQQGDVVAFISTPQLGDSFKLSSFNLPLRRAEVNAEFSIVQRDI